MKERFIGLKESCKEEEVVKDQTYCTGNIMLLWFVNIL